MTEEVIGFWAQREKYGCFSNFYPCEFIWRGVKFNCSEQAFMYAKATFFRDNEIAEKIMCESDPRKIKKLGRQIKNFDDSAWGQVRYEYMLAINKEKYFQNQNLKNRLLSTNNAIIVEDSPYDYIWGIGKNKTGQNLLGKVLMEVRDWLQN